jgi:hypothetical protein
MTKKHNLEQADLFVKTFESLKAESDRGCVLVVASLIENILEEQIIARLSPKAGKSDELLSKTSNGVISNFSSKINLAYRLGLIPISERAIYHQLRELRNACAHHVEQQDFEQNHFKDRTKNIISESSIIWEIFKEKAAVTTSDEIKSVEDYVNSIGWRTAFQLFFSLIIAFKKPAITRVTRITPLYDPALHPR